MSDENEEYDEEGEEDEEDEEEEEEVEEEDEAAKKEMVSADLALIQDIFSHIECTSRRITESLLLKEELKQAAETIKTLEASQSSNGNRYNDHNEGHSEYGDKEAEIEEESVTWSQYEELDEARRAKLLEKSLMLLAGGGRSSPHRNNGNKNGGVHRQSGSTGVKKCKN